MLSSNPRRRSTSRSRCGRATGSAGRRSQRCRFASPTGPTRCWAGANTAKDDCRIKEQADHNIKYLVAAALLDGEVGPGQFEPERIARGDVQALLRRVTVRPDAGFTRRIPDEMPVRMTVRTADGHSFDGEKTDYEGFHTRPMSWDAVEAKFDRLTAEMLDPALGREIVAAVRGLESLAVADLMALLARAATVAG